jgi:hypothetical protein
MSPLIPAVIDIEASGFGSQGYPIEIGFIDEQRNTHCFLVEPQWNWTFWDESAESLHGITRQILRDYGRTAGDVAKYMNAILQGKIIYSDAWSYDMSWLGKLYDAVDMPQVFRIASLLDLLSDPQRDKWDGVKLQVIDEFDFKRHRATNDAKIIQETYRRVVSEV